MTTQTPKANKISQGASLSQVDLDPKHFAAPVNKTLLAQYVRVYLTNARQGTASSKDRSQIRGTTKKMYKQKGTGNARHASAKAPIFVGGGVAGGPKPKEYDLKLSKKQRTMALTSALSLAASLKHISILDDTAVTAITKTKSFVEFLGAVQIKARSLALVVDPVKDLALSRSARNVAGLQLISSHELNAYDVARARHILFSASAYERLVTPRS